MTTTKKPRVASGVVRINVQQRFQWRDHPRWRPGPSTADGFWMVERTDSAPFAVRVIIDNDAPVVGAYAIYLALADACNADEIAEQDAYLSNLSELAELPPEELTRLHGAVQAGTVGGPGDGRQPRRASRR